MQKELPSDKMLLVLLVAAVFAGAFLLIQVFFKPSSGEQVLNDVRVLATKQELAGILSADPILIEMQLYEGNDTRNTILTGVTAEIASTLAQYKRRNFVYGSIDGNASVNCVAQTNYCSGAVVVVRLGDCNCLRVENGKAVAEGTREFFSDFEHVKVFKGVFGVAVAG